MSTSINSSGVTFPDATTQTTAAGVSFPGVLGQVFTSSGTFTIPSGVTALKVTVVGGGGSGVTYNNSIGIVNGNSGGNSTVSSGSQTITTLTGGGGGGGGYQLFSVGGTASNGDLNVRGNTGSPVQISGGPCGVGADAQLAGSSIYSGSLGNMSGSGSAPAGYAYGGGALGALYGGPGAGAGTAIKYLTGLTSGNTLSVTVGAGGTAASGTYTGGTGGAGVVIFEW